MVYEGRGHLQSCCGADRRGSWPALHQWWPPWCGGRCRCTGSGAGEKRRLRHRSYS